MHNIFARFDKKKDVNSMIVVFIIVDVFVSYLH